MRPLKASHLELVQYRTLLEGELIKDSLSERTANCFLKTLDDYIDRGFNFTLESLTKYLLENESSHIYNMTLKAFRHFSRILIEKKDVRRDEIAWVGAVRNLQYREVKKNPTRALSWEVFVEARAFFRSYNQGRHLLFFDIAANTGARTAELAKLQKGDIEFVADRAYLNVVQKRNRKSSFSKMRRVPVAHRGLVIMLRRLCGHNCILVPEIQYNYARQQLIGFDQKLKTVGLIPHLFDFTDYPIFVRSDDKVFTSASTLQKASEKFQRQSGHRFHLHQLRATAISLFDHSGVVNDVVKEYLAEEGFDKANSAKAFRSWVGHTGSHGKKMFEQYSHPDVIERWPQL